MSRVSSLVLGSFVAILATAATSAGCKVSVETKTRYVEDNITVEDSAVWAGEPIVIEIQGVGLAQGTSGVTVSSVQNTNKVVANARLLAMAFPENKADADLSIADVKAGFRVTRENGTIFVRCPHGQTHGESNAGESGCELANIEVPAGTSALPVSVTVSSGNGGLRIQMFNASIGTVLANSNGADSSINADLPATQGGVISLVSNQADDVALNLPLNFAADTIELVADPNEVQVGPFTDITTFNGTTGRGTAGTGLASLKLTSKEFAGTTGTVFLQASQ